MSSGRFRAGVSDVAVPTPNAILLPSCSTLVFTASGDTLTDVLHNSIQGQIGTGSTYNVCVGLVGRDNTSGGYSVTPTSAAAGPIALTAGQNSIKVKLANANWPSNFQYAGFVAVFLQVGAGNFQMAMCAPVDASNDMVINVSALPLTNAESFPIATLNAATTTTSGALGDRKPTGYTFQSIAPTTNDVVITDQVGGSITFSPNTASDFSITTARSIQVTFSAMANDVKTFITAGAGEYASTVDSGHTYSTSLRAINTAQAVVKGNDPLIITMPVDPTTGVSEKVLFCSLLLQNQAELKMAWSKKNQTPTDFQYQTVPVDVLFNNQPTTFTYSRK